MGAASLHRYTAPAQGSGLLRWALSGALLGALAALVIFAPAHWLGLALEQASAGRVVMLQARGSAWTGSARLALTGGPGSTDSAVLPGVLEWRVRPHWSGLAAQIKAQCCTTQALRLDIRPHWGGATLLIADAATQWPAQVLSGLGTPWNTVQPEGDLALSTRGLSVEWNAGRVTVLGHAQLDALNIASRLSTLRPMGSYRITINGAATSTLQLETLDGSLQLTGSGQWVGARLRFNGIASAAPERAAALANLLNIIGRRSGSKSIITL